jgi:hypothetical protein
LPGAAASASWKIMNVIYVWMAAAGSDPQWPRWEWIILALVVGALVTPLAYLMGTHGGKPPEQGPPTRPRRPLLRG